MLSYKEFEVLKTILTMDLAPDAESIFEQIYFELFDGKEEVAQVLETLAQKGMLADGKVTEVMSLQLQKA